MLVKNIEIQHHGILGMKWGKKNGPPYPLDSEDHSASERKAGWRKSLDSNSSQTDNKKKGLSDKQKKAIKIGAAVAVTALAVYGGYKLSQSGKVDPLIDKGKDVVKSLFNDKSSSLNGNGGNQLLLTDLSKSIDESGKVSNVDQRIKEVTSKYEKFGFKDIMTKPTNVDEIGKAANAIKDLYK